MKRSIIALALVAAASGAQAQQTNWLAEGIGAVTGAVLCSEIGGGNARYAASGLQYARAEKRKRRGAVNINWRQ